MSEKVEGAPIQPVGKKADGYDDRMEKVLSHDSRRGSKATTNVADLSKKLENPLDGKSRQRIQADVEKFCDEKMGGQFKEEFFKGAMLAQDPKHANTLGLTEVEMERLEQESTHKWSQPKMVYYVAIISSLAAVVQGMDETVINGAQLFYVHEFGIDTSTSHGSAIEGLVNSAPYLCCFVIACWLTEPINRFVGRRGCIFWSCVVAGLASIWEGFTYSWWQLFLARFVLGFGIGPKSTTAPIYTAECSPPRIRGALVMMWQMWTAFGIMLGYIVDVIFVGLPSSLAWRLMLGSTVIAPIFVCAMIYFGPESPRWYIKKGRYEKAFEAQCRLRWTRVQAARDLYYMHANIELLAEAQKGRNMALDLFIVPRVRRATLASGIVMFMQQFCGVNVIAYYSSQVFLQSGYDRKSAIIASFGFGVINWLFAIPSIFTIDTFGRRNLLLFTFPFLCLFNLVTGFAGFAPVGSKASIALVSVGIYLFGVFYSPGEGPVPFTYSAEAFPLYIRDVGMSWATSVTWGFNFILSISFPSLLNTFKQQGAFGFYAAWCVVGWFLVLLFVPETKQLTLEELDQVFSVSTRDHARYQIANVRNTIDRKVWRKKIPPLPPLYTHERNEKLTDDT